MKAIEQIPLSWDRQCFEVPPAGSITRISPGLEQARWANLRAAISAWKAFLWNKMLAVTWHSRETKLSKKPSTLSVSF